MVGLDPGQQRLLAKGLLQGFGYPQDDVVPHLPPIAVVDGAEMADVGGDDTEAVGGGGAPPAVALLLKVVGVGEPGQQVGVGQPVEVAVEALAKEEDRHQDGQEGPQKEEQQVEGGKRLGGEDRAGAPQEGEEPRAEQGGEEDELVVGDALHG